MADRALTFRENFLRVSTLQLDVAPGEYVDVLGVLVVVLMIGFVFGYGVASWSKERLAMMSDKGCAGGDERGVLVSGLRTRTLGTMSQCTYKWKNQQPRFQVLPQTSDGVFFPDIEMDLVY